MQLIKLYTWRLRSLAKMPASCNDRLLLLRSIHGHMVGAAFTPRGNILKRLIHLYGYFHDVPSAVELAKSYADNDGVYNTMIASFNQTKLYREGTEIFYIMRLVGLTPSDGTFKEVLFAASKLGSLSYGRQLHAHLIQFGHGSSNSTSNALLKMYAKCGSMDDAKSLFQSLPYADNIIYSSMMEALGNHRRGGDVIRFLAKMILNGIQPDRLCFGILLSACSHNGMIVDGLSFFNTMRNVYRIAPEEGHYVTLIDMMGRAGRFDEAFDIVASMSFEPGQSIWTSLLSNSRTHNRLDLAVLVARKVAEMEPKNSATDVLLSNTYSAAGRHVEAAEIRKRMRDRGMSKKPGSSLIEMGSEVHQFYAGDVRHAEAIMVCDSLKRLMG